MRKNILMLASTWDHDYLSILVKGISERLENENIGLHVFNAYDDITEKNFYACDKEIFSLPNPDNYIGMIAVFNSVDSGHSMTKYIDDFMATGKPALSIDQHADNTPFFGLDNYESMFKLVEHMITEHGCKTLNYVGGPDTNEENLLRYKAYCDCLNKYNIPIEEKRVRHYRFLKDDGYLAYRDFKHLGIHLPDAVICANDYMAFGYCNEAKSDGYIAPDHFRITGFDNVAYGQTFFPSITSINRNWERLGFDAAEGLLHMVETGTLIDKHFTVGYVKLNESCGCGCATRDIRHDYAQLLSKIDRNQSFAGNQDTARKVLCSTPDLAELPNAMYRSSNALNIGGYAIVLNRAFFDNEYDKDQDIFSPTMTAYLESGIEEIDLKGNLIPAAIDSDEHSIYIFSSIHFSRESFGYCVMPFKYDFVSTANHRVFMENIALALTNIKQRQILDSMNEQLRNLYVQDALTKLYNRFGFNKFAPDYYKDHEACVFIMCIDLDNLKDINDHYGHDHGDIAIMAVANALRSVFTEDTLKIRMGGDEFLVIGQYDSDEVIRDYIKQFDEFLEEYSNSNKFPVTISASVGYVSNSGMDAEMTLETLTQWADQRMYDVKEKRHKKRK